MKWTLFIAAWALIIIGFCTDEKLVTVVAAVFMAAYAVCYHIDSRLGK